MEWKNQYEIPNSEAGRIGEDIGDNAVMGLLGGAVGKIAGNAYRNIRLGGETLRKRASVAAADAEKRAEDYVDYGHKFLNRIGMPSNIAKGKISAKDTAMVRQNAYENLTKKLPKERYTDSNNLFDSLINNAKRNRDSRAMLQKNDEEINNLFEKGIPLKDALKVQQQRIDQIPSTARDAGSILGVAAGQ